MMKTDIKISQEAKLKNILEIASNINIEEKYKQNVEK